jgi:hypothetical protein
MMPGASGCQTRGLVFFLLLLATSNVYVYGQIGSGPCRGTSSEDRIEKIEVIGARGDATVSWEYPKGVCYLDFRVSYTALDGQERETGDVVEIFTDEKIVTVKGLEKGVPYRFTVEVHYGDYDFGDAASIIDTPNVACVENTKPDAVHSVEVKNQKGDAVTLCWKPPQNSGCIDEYTVGRRMKPRRNEDEFDDAYQWDTYKFELPGCHTFKGHVDGVTYEYEIRGYNEASKSPGEPFVKEVHVASSWSCVPVAPYYEYCQAAKSKQCKPLDCEGIAANDLCGLPSVRKYDVEKKTVVQYCSMFCGCNTPDDEELETLDTSNPNESVVKNDFDCCKE